MPSVWYYHVNNLVVFLKNRQRKKPFRGLRNSDIINKSSKSFGAHLLETQTAQPRGKLAVICPLMPFPHPLQNRVPGGGESFCPCQRLVWRQVSLGPEFLGIPGFSRVLGWWYAVFGVAHYGVHFAVFSHLVASVSNLSVWHIINKSSEFEPVCYPLQTGRIFLDIVHLGYL